MSNINTIDVYCTSIVFVLVGDIMVLKMTSKYGSTYKLDDCFDYDNGITLRIDLLPPLDSHDIDFYIIKYITDDGKIFESGKLYLCHKDNLPNHIQDRLTKPLYRTDTLKIKIQGYNKQDDCILYNSLIYLNF